MGRVAVGTAQSSHKEKTINRKKTTQQGEETFPVWQAHSRTMRSIARQLRKQPTRSEHILWQAIRKRQLGGLRFLRQHPIGPAIVDFYCHEKRLAVEVDGGIHENRDVRERDLARQELIEMYGVRFFRCTAQEVEQNLEKVLEGILAAG